MTRLTANQSDRTLGHAALADSYLGGERRGLMSWLLTLDHKRIGMMYLIVIALSFFLGGVMALLVRTEHLDSGAESALMSADTYNTVFTLHGAVMTFLFIIPSIPAVIGNFALPLMLGAKDVAFPRLNLLSWYFWMAGAVVACLAIVVGRIDTGWTFYAPYSMEPTSWGIVAMTFGAFILGFSSILTGVNFIATIHMLRPPGMGWFRMPLLVWALYATAIIQVLATPVLGITLILLIAENLLEVGIFNPRYGGDPILFQHFFWFYSHPAVYIMILPGMGIISECISTHSHKHIFGYRFIAYSSILIAVFGFLVWGHHMFTSGQSVMASAVFSFLTYSVSIPSAIKVFNWLATLYKGRIELNTPMLYALFFIILFAIGGLTGLFLGALAVDVHLHDTYFVVAHFHYTMMGGTAIAFLAGLFHWWPKMTGRMYSERAGRWSAILTFLGFNLTFMPQFVLGTQGMPRRYWDIPDRVMFAIGDFDVTFLHFHQLSTIGSYLLTFGLGLAAYALLMSFVNGRKAPANPWGANTLEWKTTSPPPTENFDRTPEPGDPYNLDNIAYDEENDQYYDTRLDKPGAMGQTD